jgi:phosphotransferase system HPr-like phosphotransfer protein
MSLGAAFGDNIILKARGKDEAKAIKDLKTLVNSFK